MGGVAIALAQHSFGGANNPASMMRAGSRLDLTGAFMVAPRKTSTGPSLFNAVLGAGAVGNESVSMPDLARAGLGHALTNHS